MHLGDSTHKNFENKCVRISWFFQCPDGNRMSIENDLFKIFRGYVEKLNLVLSASSLFVFVFINYLHLYLSLPYLPFSIFPFHIYLSVYHGEEKNAMVNDKVNINGKY